MIIVMLGDNDWGHGVSISEPDNLGDERNLYVFCDAYNLMLQKLKKRYPKAQVYCCTLFSTYMPQKPSFVFPKSLYGNSIESYNYAIKEIASQHQCEVIDLFANYINIPTIDGSHPNKDGMVVIAKLIARRIMGDEAAHLDCQNNHQFVYVSGDLQTEGLMCSRCGKSVPLNYIQQGNYRGFDDSPKTEEL